MGRAAMHFAPHSRLGRDTPATSDDTTEENTQLRYDSSVPDRGYREFNTQSEVQVFLKVPSHEDPHWLDADVVGVVCESLP